jgi:formylglycine-generating enzyme required for sulfatase activity
MPAWLDVWFPWEISGGGKAGRTHTSVINIPKFYIDKMPVTNDDYAAYLKKSHWKPQSTQNWLKHWGGKTVPPSGTGKQPVTWVSFTDAQSYCLAQGKRLPHSAEWQLAAQGVDGRRWPWCALL